MATIKKLKPKTIKAIDEHKKIGKKHYYNDGQGWKTCPWAGDNQYYHDWDNLNNLKNGKVAQCGHKNNHSCSHAEYYGIKGFRNVCPIAGACGDYVQPSPIRFSNFNFEEHNVKGRIKIKKIVVSLKHKNCGIDVSNGKQYNNWGGFFEHCYIKTPKNKKSANGPKIGEYNAISLTFNEDFEVDTSKDEFEITLSYDKNIRTNPCIIYLKDFTVSIDYVPLDGPKFTITTQGNTLYKNQDGLDNNKCYKTITHTVKMNNKEAYQTLKPIYENNNIKLIQTISDENSLTKTYIYKATEKAVAKTYEIYYQSTSNSIKKTSGKYNVKVVMTQTPSVSIINKFTLGYPYDSKTNYFNVIAGEGTCYNNISLKIYDYNSNQETSVSPDPDLNQGLYNELSKLACGIYNVRVYFDNHTTPDQNQDIIIRGPSFQFKTEIIDQLGNKFNKKTFQSYKEDPTKYYYIIKRIDTEPVETPEIYVINPTFDENKTNPGYTIDGNGNIRTEIGKYFVGQFEIGFSYNNKCKDITETETIQITRQHQKYADKLYIRSRGEFSYDSLVIREGDNITYPIYAYVDEYDDYYDKIFCKINGGKAPLFELRHGLLTIKNKSDEDLKNVYIELNPFVYDAENNEYVYSNEWGSDGIFNNFKTYFYELNPNLTFIKIIDDDTTNVCIALNTLYGNEEITMKLPFSDDEKREVFLNLKINGTPITTYSYNENEVDNVMYDYLHNAAKFIVNDLIIVETNICPIPDDDLKIICEDDYIDIDAGMEYDGCNVKITDREYTITRDREGNIISVLNENNEDVSEDYIGEECYINLRYTIKNLDTTYDIPKDKLWVQIQNSPEMIEFSSDNGYIENGKLYFSGDELYSANASGDDALKANQKTYVDVRYKAIKNNQTFKTSVSTIPNDDFINLVKSKRIFYNTPTNLEINGYLSQKIVQQNNLNILTVQIKNKNKPNKDVNIVITLGDYDLINVTSLTNGSYDYVKHSTKNNYLYWTLNNIESNRTEIMKIQLKANNLNSNSHIKIQAYNYENKYDIEKTNAVIETQVYNEESFNNISFGSEIESCSPGDTIVIVNTVSEEADNLIGEPIEHIQVNNEINNKQLITQTSKLPNGNICSVLYYQIPIDYNNDYIDIITNIDNDYYQKTTKEKRLIVNI